MVRLSWPAGVLFAALALGACSLNPFGSSKPQSAALPEGGTQAAGDAPQKPRRVPESAALKRFDANGDGTLTKLELEDVLIADFKKEDVNSDQTLDTGEMRVLNERLRQEKNTSPVFDWNADGRLVYSEFATQWRTLFDRADRNRDGVVNSDELDGGGRDRTPRPLPQPEMSKVDPSQ